MGVSTDAILFWGYAFDAEDVKPWDINADEPSADDEDERYARLVPGAPSEPDEPYATDNPRWQAYYKAKRAFLESARGTLVRHCSDGCTMYAVAHRDSEQRAYRGDVKDVRCNATDDWRAELDAYCKAMGINTAGMEPGWKLVSWWG